MLFGEKSTLGQISDRLRHGSSSVHHLQSGHESSWRNRRRLLQNHCGKIPSQSNDETGEDLVAISSTTLLRLLSKKLDRFTNKTYLTSYLADNCRNKAYPQLPGVFPEMPDLCNFLWHLQSGSAFGVVA